jgi:hypothetical protein
MRAAVRSIVGVGQEPLAFEVGENRDGVIEPDAEQPCRLRRRHLQPRQREKFTAEAKRIEIGGFGERDHGQTSFPRLPEFRETDDPGEPEWITGAEADSVEHRNTSRADHGGGHKEKICTAPTRTSARQRWLG